MFTMRLFPGPTPDRNRYLGAQAARGAPNPAI
jgi:hypothetical protein